MPRYELAGELNWQPTKPKTNTLSTEPLILMRYHNIVSIEKKEYIFLIRALELIYMLNYTVKR